MIRWHDLLDRLDRARLLRAVPERFDTTDNPVIDHLAHDSRKVGPGGCFVAMRGETTDGHLFIDKAVQHGAIAILCEAMPEALDPSSGIAVAQVTNTRAALAEAAAAFYGDPSRELRLIGVTGTNGKTTTAFLIYHLLMTLGVKTGLLGTVAYRIGEATHEPTHTTPDGLDVQRLFREMVEAGCRACAMEVSSHALEQDRVRSAAFGVGIFTNLTQDHLDYHETFEAYRAAKKRLFDGLPDTATALYNDDDAAGPRMVADTRATRRSYGQAAGADYRIEVLANELTGLRLRLDGFERAFRLVGRFNAYNLAAAYGAGRALGYDPEAVLDVLADAPPVPGRFEQIRFDDGTTAIVDYAHTPDALENVLVTIRQTMPPDAALWCIFGCGGDRDRTKRPRMGRIAERYADHVIATSDNPRTEPPEQILDDIRDGMEHPEAARWIIDRQDAIQEAARCVAPGDVLLIAGKGHETYQVVGTEKRPFDDRDVIRRAYRLC